MADSEFEEFRHVFERLPQHIKAPAQSYTLVHDVCLDEDSPTSPKSDLDASDTLSAASSLNNNSLSSLGPQPPPPLPPPPPPALLNNNGGEEASPPEAKSGPPSAVAAPPPPPPWAEALRAAPGERRPRRRLPEIPKNKRPASVRCGAPSSGTSSPAPPSLADELGEALLARGEAPLMDRGDAPSPRPDALHFAIGGQTMPLLLRNKCHSYLRDEDSSPDSERFHSTDVDSGNSTAHSPDGPKSTSPPPPLGAALSPSPGSPASSASSCASGASGPLPFPHLQLLEATHRGLHKFIPRHLDEIDVEIGDPIYVQKEADDLWCEGVNLRTGRQGIFPSAYAVDVDYSDFDPSTPKVKRERYLLGYLGSVETRYHKGNEVLCQAVRKIAGGGSTAPRPHPCILEVSDQGLRMVDRRKPAPKEVPCHDYFYSLKNVSFCAFHPRDHRYMGFVTKHPQLHRFACHVFVGHESTRPVAEAVGRAFQRFYTKFIETAYPIEDIYIE